MVKLRFAEPEHLIDLNRMDELKGIRESNGVAHIGAMTSDNGLIASDVSRQHCLLLPEAARNISDPRSATRGTISGDIAHLDPANDHPALINAAADKVMEIRDPA